MWNKGLCFFIIGQVRICTSSDCQVQLNPVCYSGFSYNSISLWWGQKQLCFHEDCHTFPKSTSITQTTYRVFGERYWLLFVWKPAGHSQSAVVLIVLKCWQIEGISHSGFLWPWGCYIHPITITHFTLCEYSLTGIVCVFAVAAGIKVKAYFH